MKRLLLLLTIFIILTHSSIYSQLVKGEIHNIRLLKNGDTIVTKRTPGDWFYGPFVGVTSSHYFGKFIFPANIIQELDVYEDSIKYDGNSYFPGIFVGLLGEYNPLNSKWGMGLKLGIIDYTKMKVSYGFGDTLKKEFVNEVKFSYISLSPYVKYKFSSLKGTFWEGMYILGGLNFDIPTTAETKQIKVIYNPVRIEETATFKFKEQLFKVGLHLGFGIDLFDANVEKGARTIFSPYFTASIGSKILKDFNSNLYSFNLKLGISLLLGIDNKLYDTLKYKPIEQKPLEIPIVESSPIDIEKIISNNYNANYIEPVLIERSENKIAPSLEPAIPYNIGNEYISNDFVIEFNRKFVINYPNSGNDVELTDVSRDFLERVAKIMKLNPECIVNIEGFNDDRGGSVKENQNLSIQRAENAKQELILKGINSERIYTVGKGSIQNIASNSTTEGRAKNRRIEIIIKKNK